jgi:DNA-binding transcriptional LysR family regulator
MELRQLDHFVAVAEDQSFTRAAKRLGYVQSALSVSIRSLERELSVQLFDRTTHRVRLTDAGQALLPAARATLASAEAVRDEAAAVNGAVRGRLRIGTMQAFTALNVPRLLGRFHREHPDVEITLRPAVGGAQALLAGVTEGELDLAFVAVGENPRGVRLLPLATERLLLTSRAGGDPPPASPVDLRDLEGQSFVDFPTGWIVRTLVDRAFTALEVHRQVAIEVADVPACRQLVREGLGVALLPKSIIEADPSGLQTQRVTPELSWNVVVALRDDTAPSPAAAAFLELLEFERAAAPA